MDETEIDLRAILGLLRRRLRLILATIVLVVGAAALITVSLTPKYTASVLVLFDPSSRTLVDPQMQAVSASSESARVDSEVEIIKSDAVLLDTIRRENLVSDGEFGVSLGLVDRLLMQFNIAKPKLPTGETALTNVLKKLRNALSVSRRGLTYLINVSMTAELPDTAAKLANAVAQSYVDTQVQNKIDAALAARNVLQKRLDLGQCGNYGGRTIVRRLHRQQHRHDYARDWPPGCRPAAVRTGKPGSAAPPELVDLCRHREGHAVGQLASGGVKPARRCGG